METLKVISASRRVEMVGFYPRRLASLLREKCPPEKVHSIVLWSKDPRNLVSHGDLRSVLSSYDLLFLHFTISGMGGSSLEPGIPSTSESLALLRPLAEFLGGPDRMALRFDPIVHISLPSGKEYTNLGEFGAISREAARLGVHRIVISWMSVYEKVIRRLEKAGMAPIEVSKERWDSEWEWLKKIAEACGAILSGCCVPQLPVSGCIDGRLLSSMHPGRKCASLLKAKGQRPGCGCTESWDIGWYYPCPGGCLYCYANPVETPLSENVPPAGEKKDRGGRPLPG